MIRPVPRTERNSPAAADDPPEVTPPRHPARWSAAALALALVAPAGCRPAIASAPAPPAPPTATSTPEPPGPVTAEPPGPVTAEADGPGRIRVGTAVLTVEYEGRDPPLPPAQMEAWVRRSAGMVADYLGEFPVPSLAITLVGRGLGGVGFGMHNEGRWLTIHCGRTTDADDLEDDWVMVHEMLHAAFPDLERDHRWMQEGLSTYLEPIVRARAGNTSEQQVWARFVRSMHFGRPGPGDRGLDLTHTWGRTYWGGALFWMVADVELRKQTGNRKSLRDAVRGILAAGGNGRVDWSTARVVEVADAATGTTVLGDLYARMAQAPGDVDLDGLYAELGIAKVDGEIVFDDDAPLAHVRRAMTRP